MSGAAAAYAVIFCVLIGYFTWICLQMARHAVGGATLVGTIFGSALLGVGAVAAGVVLGKRGRR